MESCILPSLYQIRLDWWVRTYHSVLMAHALSMLNHGMPIGTNVIQACTNILCINNYVRWPASRRLPTFLLDSIVIYSRPARCPMPQLLAVTVLRHLTKSYACVYISSCFRLSVPQQRYWPIEARICVVNIYMYTKRFACVWFVYMSTNVRFWHKRTKCEHHRRQRADKALAHDGLEWLLRGQHHHLPSCRQRVIKGWCTRKREGVRRKSVPSEYYCHNHTGNIQKLIVSGLSVLVHHHFATVPKIL